MENETIGQQGETGKGTKTVEVVHSEEDKKMQEETIRQQEKNGEPQGKEENEATIASGKKEDKKMRIIEYKRNYMGWNEIRGKELSREWEEHIVPAYQIPEYWVRIQEKEGKWSDWIGTNLSPVVQMANGEIL